MESSVFNKDILEEIHNTFLFWYESGEEFGMTQYSKGNCDKGESIFLNLTAALEGLGINGDEETKILAFKSSVEAMNNLNNLIPGFIETGERETLCDLFDEVAKLAGLDPSKFGSGDGIASEWREW